MMNNIIPKFKFMCTKILPTIFDDSLSYYEALCKISRKTNELVDQVNKNTETLDGITDVETLIIDQTFIPTSKHAQSGTAVKEAIDSIEMPEGVIVDQTFNPISSNAQSGTAVKEAIDSIEVPEDIIVDQSFNPNSSNAQSGTAVKEAIDSIEVPEGVTVDQTFNPNSSNAISGSGVNNALNSVSCYINKTIKPTEWDSVTTDISSLNKWEYYTPVRTPFPPNSSYILGGGVGNIVSSGLNYLLVVGSGPDSLAGTMGVKINVYGTATVPPQEDVITQIVLIRGELIK